MAGQIKFASVGHMKKGSYIIIDDAACQVTDVSVSRPGKHGHAKVNLMAVGMIDGRKRNLVMPGHDNVEVPVIGKKNAQVLSISENMANVMDSESYETFDIEIPADLKEEVVDGCTVLYWEILTDNIMKSIKKD